MIKEIRDLRKRLDETRIEKGSTNKQKIFQITENRLDESKRFSDSSGKESNSFSKFKHPKTYQPRNNRSSNWHQRSWNKLTMIDGRTPNQNRLRLPNHFGQFNRPQTSLQYDYKPNAYCDIHHTVGHWTSECRLNKRHPNEEWNPANRYNHDRLG